MVDLLSTQRDLEKSDTDTQAALEGALSDLGAEKGTFTKRPKQRIRELFKQLVEERDMARRGQAMESLAGDVLETEIKQRIPVAKVREMLITTYWACFMTDETNFERRAQLAKQANKRKGPYLELIDAILKAYGYEVNDGEGQ